MCPRRRTSEEGRRMTPGQRRGFTALASLTLPRPRWAARCRPQEPANIDNLMFGSEYAPTEGTPGGSVVIADWQIPDNMNYYLQNAFVNTQVISSVFDYALGRIVGLQVHPGASISIPKLSDGTMRIDAEPTAECEKRPAGSEDVPGFEVDLNIRPDLKWSDGETLDLNDLKYTSDWIMSGPTGLTSGTVGWDIIDRFDVAEDGLTATVHFCTGYAGFYGLFFGSPMLPEHYMSKIRSRTHRPFPTRSPRPRWTPRPRAPSSSRSLSPSAIELTRNELLEEPLGRPRDLPRPLSYIGSSTISKDAYDRCLPVGRDRRRPRTCSRVTTPPSRTRPRASRRASCPRGRPSTSTSTSQAAVRARAIRP